MSVTVTKTGPFFASGEIKFSQMRTSFEGPTGPIKASEYFRNTNIYDRSPIVPDSTENDQIADPYSGGTDATKAPFEFKGTGTNWKASLMRNSIKRYFATQSGTDVNFEMGLFTASGSKGIDWNGQGVADAVGSVTGNITRNIYKEIRITGTCGSTDTGVDGTTGSGGVGKQKKPAAKLELPSGMKAINVTIKNSGNIHGAGGLSGFFPDGTSPLDTSDPGKDGGIALKIFHEGEESKTYIQNTGYIFGGGGGGEQGQHGYINPAGLDAMRANCYADNSYNYFGGYYNTCNGESVQNSCGSDTVLRPLWSFRIQCDDSDPANPYDGWVGNAYCRHVDITNEQSSAPVQGRGGQGGNGRGYTQSRTTGQAGTDPGSAICPTCPAGTAANPGGECSGPGGKGGDGGDWGATGESTTGISPAASGLSQGEGGGKSGPSICGKNYFAATGSTGAANIKGPRNTNCEGASSNPVNPGNPPGISLTVNQNAGHNSCYVRFNKPATHLMVTRLDPTDATNFKQTSQFDVVWFRIWHRWSDSRKRDGVALWRFRIRDPNLAHDHPKSVVYDSGRYGQHGEYEGPPNTGNPYPNDTGPDIGLGTGIYPIEWYGLAERNKEALDPNDLGGLSKYNAPQQRFASQGWQTFEYNEQEIVLVDDARNNINQRISILPPKQSTHYEPGMESTYRDTLWFKSYDNIAARATGMEDNWSSYLKNGAVTTSNTTTQNLYEQKGEVTFNASAAGTYTVKAASDNGCKFKWTGGNFPSQTFVTPKFFSSGASWGFGEAPAGFTEKGRIWPFTSEGGADENLNDSNNTWAPEGPNLTNGAYNMGPTYFQITLTAAQVGEKTLEFNLTNSHQLKDPPYTVTPGANPAVVYNFIDDFSQPNAGEIAAEEAAIAAGAQPSDRYKNWNYGHNPSGVAFAVYDPSGNVIARSTDLVSNQPYVYGSPTITCSASNILPNTSNPLHQVQCQTLSKEEQLLHYSYIAYDSNDNGSNTGIFASNTTKSTPNNPDAGTAIEFRSDDSVPQGTLNSASAVSTITPSPNNNGPMEYEFIASNPAGSATKKMTIN